LEKCHCDDAEACSALGGSPGSMSCGEGMKHMGPEEMSVIKQAHEAGTCTSIHMPWGELLEQWMDHPARKCCSSYPATACAPTAVQVTPCKATSDLKADEVLHSWCEIPGSPPPKAPCEAAGCSHSEWESDGIIEMSCHCETQAACESLKGKFQQRTCGQEVDGYDFQTRKALQDLGNGTCAEAWMPWGEAAVDWVRGQADRCCESFPATVCNPEAELQTPCASSEAFNSTAVIHEWCQYNGIEPAYEVCEDLGFCHCHTKAACEHFKGTFHTETCGEYARHWDEGGRSLIAAKSAETCEGVETTWGESLESAIAHYAKQCCTSFPSTICGSAETGGAEAVMLKSGPREEKEKKAEQPRDLQTKA